MPQLQKSCDTEQIYNLSEFQAGLNVYMDANKMAHSWDQLAQFHLIEVVTLWEGRLTSKHLQQAFSIGRSKASEIIKSYLAEKPNNITHCNSIKGYILGEDFIPSFSRGDVHEYLKLLQSADVHNHYLTAPTDIQTPIEKLPVAARPVDPEVVRIILQAVRNKQRIITQYRSISEPCGDERIIAPHTLVSANGRWHVRAFCEKNRDFRDFVLHRFNTIPELESERYGYSDPSLDTDWNRYVMMKIIPNPRLDPEQQQVVADDYHMGNERVLTIPLRASLVKYMAVDLRIGSEKEALENPVAHQLDLANRNELNGLILN